MESYDETTIDASEEFIPSEADVASYYAWRSASDARAALTGPDFRATIARVVDLFRDSDDETLRFVGDEVAKLHDLAVYLEATSAEQFIDRRDALIDGKAR